MKRIALFIFAAFGLTSLSFAQLSEQELKDYIKKTCAGVRHEQDCACIISKLAPHFPSTEALDRINRLKISAQEKKKINGLIADINRQCGTQLKPIVTEEK